MALYYPIRAASRLTGISVDTLRAWERRYQAVVPVRNERGRVYSERHVERLRLLSALIENGHAIGSIAGLSDVALRKLRRSAGGTDTVATAPARIDLEPLRVALSRYDQAVLESILNRHALVLPPPELIFGVVLPMLRDAGAQWEAGAICPAQEHLVSGLIRGVLGGILRSLPRRAGGMRIVFAAPPGEVHELGLLSAAVLAAWTGCDTVYLGANLPAAHVAHAIKVSKASGLILASTMSDANPADVKAFMRLPAHVSIWTGGAQAGALRDRIGARARIVNSLEELRGLLDPRPDARLPHIQNLL
jgi:DNA-binding transcriptional MerR regulator